MNEHPFSLCKNFNQEIGCKKADCVCEKQEILSKAKISATNQTIEEAAENYVNSFSYGIAHPKRVCKKAFANGAKSQSARDYWYNIFKSEQQCLTIPDIRNKLSPFTLIIDFLEEQEFVYAIKCIQEAKKSVNYLSNSENYKI